MAKKFKIGKRIIRSALPQWNKRHILARRSSAAEILVFYSCRKKRE